MEKKNYKVLIFIAGLLLLAFIYQGCEKKEEAEYVPTTPVGGGGTGGVPGGTGTEVYVASWSDNSVESDVIRDLDCDDDLTTIDPELMYNDEVTVTIRNKIPKNVHIDSYIVRYKDAPITPYSGRIDLLLHGTGTASASIYLVTLNKKLEVCPGFSTPCNAPLPLDAEAIVTFYGTIEADEPIQFSSGLSINFADYVMGCK